MTWQNRLRFAIARSGKTLDAVASEAGVSEAGLRIILEGGSDPDVDTVIRLAAAAGVTVASLLGETPTTEVRVRELPDEEIPTEFAARGATLAYEVLGNGLWNAGIAAGDVVCVRPAADAAGKMAVCRRTDGELMLVHDGANEPDVIGVVVGRYGAI